MNACHEVKNGSGYDKGSSNNEALKCVGLDVLANVAVIANHIAGDEDRNTRNGTLQSSMKCDNNSIKIETGASESFHIRRKNLEMLEYVNHDISVVTDEMDFSDQDDVGYESVTSCPDCSKAKDISEDNHFSPVAHATTESEISNNLTNANFVTMLMDILSSKSMEDVISWLPEGNAFIVINEEEFTNMLPFCFELIKFESFVKRLYCWGFRPLGLGLKNKAFYHECFLRDFPSLCSRITKVNVTFDPIKTMEKMNIERKLKLNNLALESNSNLRFVCSAQTFEMNRYSQQRQQSQLHLQTRFAPIINGSNVTNFNSMHQYTSYADIIVKNFFDRKMNKIRSQYMKTHNRRFKRHSMGL